MVSYHVFWCSNRHYADKLIYFNLQVSLHHVVFPVHGIPKFHLGGAASNKKPTSFRSDVCVPDSTRSPGQNYIFNFYIKLIDIKKYKKWLG